MSKEILKKVFAWLFTFLYAGIGIVSILDSMEFFLMTKPGWQADLLAVLFELGQASIVFYLLIRKQDDTIKNVKYYFKQSVPYILMSLFTIVQVAGNIFASYKYMMEHSTGLLKYFTDSVMFFISDPDPQVNYVLISYFTGAILPIAALLMVTMVEDVINKPDAKIDMRKKNQPKIIL